MGKKDIATKALEWYNDVFADIVNVLLFDGREVIRPDELVSSEKDSHYKADGNIRSQERDVLKYWKKSGIIISAIGAENQVKAEKEMVIRVMSYDGAEYRNQVKAGNDEYYPVITLVLYFGEDDWTYGTNLHSCLTIPEELKPYVSDYKMNFISMKDLTDEQIDKFQSDFKAIAGFFRALSNHEKYRPSEKILDHPEETLDMIGIFSGDDRFRDVYNELHYKGGINMCRIYDDILDEGVEIGVEKGRKEGRKEGREEGREEGIEEEKARGIKKAIIMLKNVGATVDAIIKNIMQQYEMSRDEAEMYVNAELTQMG